MNLTALKNQCELSGGCRSPLYQCGRCPFRAGVAWRASELERVLRMGLQLGESGGHGSGNKCPTCHFVREARKALGNIKGEN